MKFMVHVEGPAFEKDAALSETLGVLAHYNEGFSICLQKSAKRHSTREIIVPAPILKLRTVSPGSLELQTVVDLAVGIVPAAPQVISYGWELYKKASELISMATSLFQRFNRPPVIKIDNSPGALSVVNQGSNNVIIVGQDALDMGRATHKHFDALAKLITPTKASHICIQPDTPQLEPVAIDRQNYTLFTLPDQEIEELEAVELECSIYRLNTKSASGYLEIQEDSGPRRFPFIVEDGALEDYIDAMKASSSTVLARRDMVVNALGEKTLKRFRLIKITNRFDPDDVA